MFLSAVWTQILRHPFTTDDPLVSKWSKVKFLQIFADEETNYFASGMARFTRFTLNFGDNYFFKIILPG